MSARTSIQWADTTVNPTMGCSGCELWTPGRRACYAGVLTRRFAGRKGYPRRFEEPELFPGRMAKAAAMRDLAGTDRVGKPWLNGLPRLIFVGDMGDTFDHSIEFEYLRREVFAVANADAGARHVWLLLSKRPTRMGIFAMWLRDEHGEYWPPNVWAMTTVTGAATEKRADALRAIPGPVVRAISFEPIDDEPDWDRCLARGVDDDGAEAGIDWAIFGGESAPGARVETGDRRAGAARPLDVDIIRRGIGAARRHGAAPFVKQLGSNPVNLTIGKRVLDRMGGNWGEWPAGLRVREVPRDLAMLTSGAGDRLAGAGAASGAWTGGAA